MQLDVAQGEPRAVAVEVRAADQLEAEGVDVEVDGPADVRDDDLHKGKGGAERRRAGATTSEEGSSKLLAPPLRTATWFNFTMELPRPLRSTAGSQYMPGRAGLEPCSGPTGASSFAPAPPPREPLSAAALRRLRPCGKMFPSTPREPTTRPRTKEAEAPHRQASQAADDGPVSRDGQ